MQLLKPGTPFDLAQAGRGPPLTVLMVSNLGWTSNTNYRRLQASRGLLQLCDL